MARIFGTPGVDSYLGTVDDIDIAVIGSRGVHTVFRAASTGWMVIGPQGTDTLTSIEQVELSDALYTLTLPATAAVANSVTTSGVDVADLANGNYVVTWASSSFGVQFQIFNSRNEAVSAVLTTAAGTQPSVTANGTGGFAVTFTNGSSDVYIQQYTSDGTATGTAFLANTTTTGSQFASDLVYLANGSSVAIWQDASVAPGTIRFQRFTDTGAPLGGETIVGFPNTVTFSAADAIALPGGGFVLTAQSTSQVYLQAFSASGSAVGDPVHVTQNISLGSGQRHFLFETSSGFGVSWSRSDGAIVYQLFDSGRNPIGAEVVLPIANPFLIGMEQLGSGQFAVLYYAAGQNFVQLVNADGSLSGERTLLDIPSGVPELQTTVLDDGGLGIVWQIGSQTGRLRIDAAGDLALATIQGEADPNHITANSFTGTTYQQFAYTLSGFGGDDVLTGSNLSDRLIGGLGADRLIGGNGNDLYIADSLDTIVETETGGTDTVRVTSTFVLTADWVENLVLSGNTVANLTGNGLDNRLTGNERDNVINGGLGADTMVGRGGNDTYLIDNISDVVEELAGGGIDTVLSTIQSFTLGANAEILQLEGTLAINGTGNALDNQIFGNEGDNSLSGLGGADTLVGGGGNDAYEVDVFDQVTEAANGGIDTIYATGSWALSENVENLVLNDPGSNGGWNATGNALANTIYGNAFANVIDGDEGADIMYGGAGADTYIVDDAGDQVFESSFTETDLVLSSVSFALGQYVENLTLTGIASIDGTGNFSSNTIRGNGARNLLDGDTGVDYLYGGAGNDRLTSQFGGDFLYGGTGDDVYNLGTGSDTIVELRNQGTDTVIVAATANWSYTLGLNLENLELNGIGGRGFGNALNNDIMGNLGANTIDGGAGDDTMRGLAGDDTYVVDAAGDSVIEASSNGRDRVLASLDYTLGANVEDLVLIGSGATNGTGNALANRIEGNSANNTVLGLDGDDVLVGGGGNDFLDGGVGDDLLFAGTGSDDLHGRAGFDTASYRTISTGVIVNLALTGFQNTGGGGLDRLRAIENLDGSNVGGDTLSGNEFANVLRGYGGDDVLDGRDGNDNLRGMEGNDLLFSDLGDDVLHGGNGIDTVDFRNVANGVTVNLEIVTRQQTGAGNDRLLSIENLRGTSSADSFTGDQYNNELIGQGGDDILAGGAGNDILEGGTGVDTADYSGSYAGVVVDLVNSFADDGLGGSDTLIAVENVVGSQFDDVIIGNNRINTLTGDLGRDVLVGGSNADTFVFLSAEDSGLTDDTRDIIRDFQTGDLIDLSRIDANSATVGDDAFTTIINPAAAFTTAGQLRIVDGILYGNTDGDAAAEFSIDLNGVQALTTVDFIL